jgi:hypothetical protein
LTIIPDNIATRNAERVCYWDNISFNSNAPNALYLQNAYNIRLFPNPVKDYFKITTDGQICGISIRNLVGQTIMNAEANSNEVNLDMRTISTGNYLITIKLMNGESLTRKIVKL